MKDESIVFEWLNFDNLIASDWNFKSAARIVSWGCRNRVVACTKFYSSALGTEWRRDVYKVIEDSVSCPN